MNVLAHLLVGVLVDIDRELLGHLDELTLHHEKADEQNIFGADNHEGQEIPTDGKDDEDH